MKKYFLYVWTEDNNGQHAVGNAAFEQLRDAIAAYNAALVNNSNYHARLISYGITLFKY